MLLWLRFRKWCLPPDGSSSNPSCLLDVLHVVDVVLEHSSGNGACWHAGSLSPTWSSLGCPSEGLFSCGIAITACMQTIFCDGSVYKTKQMAHPLAVAWGPHATMQPLWWPYGHVCWLLIPLVPPSLPVTCCAQGLTPWLLSSGNHALSGSFCETGVTLNWWVSAWNTPILQWFPFETGLETCADIWVPAAVSTCIHFNLVRQCYHCCELGLYFHPKVY